MIVIQAKLIFLSQDDKQIVLDLMRRWSSCMRFAYKRLLEGYDRNTLKRELQGIFNLNSRYVDDAIMKARSTLESSKELGNNPKKVIFGGKDLFKKLQKRHINGKEYKKLKTKWQERRKGNLYSRGDKSKKGNLNTRIEVKENGTFLRINVGERKYLYARIEAGYKKNKSRGKLLQEIAQSNIPYSVEVKLKNGNIYAYFAIEKEYPEIKITKEKGVIGIDVNAYPDNISWAETDEKGNLISYGNMPMTELASGSKDKKEYFRWQYAHEIVNIAKEKGKAIVIEGLDIKNKGKRGDFSGRKSRRIRHNFSYRALLSKIKTLAKREGIEVIEVNPSYTSIIGMLKYSPQYMITKDIAAAYVIARRGLGKEEKMPNNYMKFLNALTVDELEELKEHVKKTVRNKHINKKHLKEIDKAIKFLQSLESKPGRVLEPLNGTSFSAYNFWQVLKVAVVTPLSPEKVPRDFSALRELLIQGKWGDP
ncbi:MAG: Transposase [Caldanaerobacter subterraneus]|uniref:Transposase, putative n=2 Tax=Thermoanaerobacter TaxID=1754 RepID=B0KD19_THEP3|nr:MULTISPECIES: IS200/IS605 family accessory protein TnpB-related protein [Thermoanaerobacter]KUJ91762.1 MAG: transposase [Thermoanaerobacter thermocopriae]KUK35618.1 MAG: Transposase [Caldanaerobacter subterraneus]ABY94117.1 transposase, putative [Thermoanaerobacter pseudethanolicus ATCC 33223]ADV79072.1 transposase [Thermoanaerobacter brockii subsp. finnii Ako-1]HAA80074.1 transposase [Thermoanaerobacter sp.]